MMSVILALVGLLSVGSGAPAGAQQCDDADSCTSNDMCVGGECSGTPASGGSCNDGNACTINDTCVGGTCMGSPAPSGTSCNGGCGTCMELAPGFPSFCVPPDPNEGTDDQPCNDGIACTINDVCQSGFCFGTFRQCPDSDGNPCTGDFCDFETGECQATELPPCPLCQTCRVNGSTFVCEPAANGVACDDFNVCTASSMCSGGECVEGVPTGPTPTPTTVVGPPTATATLPAPTATAVVPTATQPVATATAVAPTSTPGGTTCVGDCGGDGQVSVDEIIRAVNIALGNLTVNDCPAADGNGDGFVTVDEIVSAVNNALNGCRA